MLTKTPRMDKWYESHYFFPALILLSRRDLLVLSLQFCVFPLLYGFVFFFLLSCFCQASVGKGVVFVPTALGMFIF